MAIQRRYAMPHAAPEETVERPLALKEWAYQRLRERILNLDLPPGAAIDINECAEQMVISRTPIREALLQLESEGLVRVQPRVGFFVAEIAPSDLEHLFELRGLLEGYATEVVAARLSDDDLARIESLLDACNGSLGEEQVSGFFATDLAFHGLLVEYAANPWLTRMIGLLEDLTHRELALGLKSTANVQSSCAEHKQILAALRARDGVLAGQLMRTHLNNVKNRLLQLYEQHDES